MHKEILGDMYPGHLPLGGGAVDGLPHGRLSAVHFERGTSVIFVNLLVEELFFQFHHEKVPF